MGKTVTICLLAVLLDYYAFTSGLVFELTKSEAVGQLDTPYSIALSNERIRLVGVSNEDDLACAKWVVEETDSSIPILTDYCGISLIIDHSDAGRHVVEKPEGEYYIFLTTWNTQQGEMVQGWFEGLREYTPLPDLDEATVVYQRGDAVVYEVKGGE